MTKRSRFEIMAEILRFCKKPQGKTRVMHHVGLCWKNHQKYLNVLESKGFVQIHHSPILYVTTQKGREFIEKMERLSACMHAEGSNS
jgi:predicted transcriptional regulator